MKDMDELEKMTLWDITTNEGALTQLVIGMSMIYLSVTYSFIYVYYKVKYNRFRRWRL